MPDTTPDTDPGAGTDADGGSEEPRLWQVKIAMIATSAEHEELMDRLADVLCPDPDHDGPCPVPWGMHSINGDSLTDEERSALFTEIEETNWNLKEGPRTAKAESSSETGGSGQSDCPRPPHVSRPPSMPAPAFPLRFGFAASVGTAGPATRHT